MLKINEIELASELADIATENEVINDNVNFPDIREKKDLTYIAENGDCMFKEEIEDVFIKWYDYYSEIIQKSAV